MTEPIDDRAALAVLTDQEAGEDQLADVINEVTDRGWRSAAPAILHLLQTTQHKRLRNAAAYYFHKIRVPEVVPQLVEVAERDQLHGTRGTLLYALSGYDCSPFLPFLASVVTSDEYEAAHHACDAIEALPATVPRDGAQTALAVLRAAKPTEQWGIDMIDFAIAELTGRRQV